MFIRLPFVSTRLLSCFPRPCNVPVTVFIGCCGRVAALSRSTRPGNMSITILIGSSGCSATVRTCRSATARGVSILVTIARCHHPLLGGTTLRCSCRMPILVFVHDGLRSVCMRGSLYSTRNVSITVALNFCCSCGLRIGVQRHQAEHQCQ